MINRIGRDKVVIFVRGPKGLRDALIKEMIKAGIDREGNVETDTVEAGTTDSEMSTSKNAFKRNFINHRKIVIVSGDFLKPQDWQRFAAIARTHEDTRTVFGAVDLSDSPDHRISQDVDHWIPKDLAVATVHNLVNA